MSHDDKQSVADNQKLDHVLQKKQAEENRVIKLLLLGIAPLHVSFALATLTLIQSTAFGYAALPSCVHTAGTGESGKSTIFKQMQIIYGQEGFRSVTRPSGIGVA